MQTFRLSVRKPWERREIIRSKVPGERAVRTKGRWLLVISSRKSMAAS